MTIGGYIIAGYFILAIVYVGVLAFFAAQYWVKILFSK